MLLILGDTGSAVKVLQHRLSKAGYDVIEDGSFGPLTFQAVTHFQQKNNLVVDGIVGKKTESALLGHDQQRWLSQADLELAAAELSVDMASIHAIKTVESKSVGFLEDGRPKILYERHIMRRQMQKNGVGKIAISNAMQQFPDLVNTSPGGYKGGTRAHYRLSLAKTIDRVSALESCSWGLFQIMGFHWRALGYKSVDEFIELMHLNESNHWQAFIRFILADKKLHLALKDKNWAEFARRYNGPNYKKNKYDVKLQAAHEDYLLTMEETR